MIERRKCTCCQKQEKKYGDYAKCSRCNEAHYCGRDCQIKDWKIHKLLCGNKNTTKITSDLLLDCARPVLLNLTDSLKKRFGIVVSEENQRNALKGLVAMYKECILYDDRLKKYNKHSAFGDLGSDLVFERKLMDFIVQQPGYEAWAYLKDEYLEKKEEATNDPDILKPGVGNVLNELCNGSVELMISHFAEKNPEMDKAMKKKLMSPKRKKKAVVRLADMCRDIIRKKPQFNCMDGLRGILEDEDYMKGFVVIMIGKDGIYEDVDVGE